MAHTTAGAELTASHRAAQAGITASLVDILGDMFLDLFNVNDIDGSSRAFIRKALPVVLKARDMSKDVAITYLDNFRKVELRGLVDHADLAPDVADPHAIPLDVLEAMARAGLMSPEAVADHARELEVDLPDPVEVVDALYSSTAAVAKKRIKSGDSPAQAAKSARQAVQAKSIRLVADGGRAPMLKEVRTGRNGAVGYARVVDADPCPFCAMLASRGAVYRSDSFSSSNNLFAGDGDFKTHDGCECTLEPVYGRGATHLPPGSAGLAQEWAEVAAGQPDPWGAWRRYRTSGTLPGDENSRVDTETSRPSAPQTGRARKRKQPGRKGRKDIGELNKTELETTLRGLYIRRAGLEQDLAALEDKGQSTREPGPAQAISKQLDRIERQIKHAKQRLGTM